MKTSLIISIFFFISVVYSQDELKVLQDIQKEMIFEEHLLENEKEFKTKCENWNLNTDDVYFIFSKSKLETSEVINSEYYYLPCYYISKAEYKGEIYTIKINAASFVVLFNDKKTLYFGCKDTDLKDYFVLEPNCCAE